MARIIKTHELTPTTLKSSTDRHHIYNGLDSCVTFEIFQSLSALLDPVSRATYEFSKALQGPILEMNLRGVLVDRAEAAKLIKEYTHDVDRLRRQLDRIIKESGITDRKWYGAKGSPSPDTLKYIFYEVLGLPPIRKRNTKGGFSPTVNREALERLRAYMVAEPIVNHILLMRDFGKRISLLSTDIDGDNRIRTSFNIAGTTTGRLASSNSDFGTGTNLQNIERRLRRVFIADPGMIFANIDLEQADARNVGAICLELFNDPTYLDACESGDLHTAVCRLAWPDLPWTDDRKANRQIADQICYRDLTYRDMAKKLGHGTNYLGTPATMAKHTKVPIPQIAMFQQRYFQAFPAILKWHLWVRQELAARGYLTTLMGRRRYFFGNRQDDDTLREAVAYAPQSMTADQIDTALLNVWRKGLADPLLQVHDSLLLQFPAHENRIPALMECFKVPIMIRGREFIVPAEAKVGWNWADVEYNKAGEAAGNFDGLKKYSTNDSRKRQPALSLMDRVLY